MDNISTPVQQRFTEEDGQLDLGHMLDVMYDYRWMMGGVILVIFLIGAIYAFTATPVYRADILVQVEENPNSTRSLLSDVSTLFDIKSQASTEIEIIKSRLVVGKAVNNLRLDIDAEPLRFPFLGEWISRFNSTISKPGLFGFGGFVWGRESIKVSKFDVPPSLYGREFQLELANGGHYSLIDKEHNLAYRGEIGHRLVATSPFGEINLLVDYVHGAPGARFTLIQRSPVGTVAALQGKLQIAEKGKESDVIGVALEGERPAHIADILTEIAKEYINQNIERKSEEAQKSLKFLDKQLPELKSRLEAAEQRFNSFRVKNNTVDLSGEAASTLQNSVTLQSALLQLVQQRDELVTKFTPNYPSVKAIDAQIARYKNAIAENEARTRALPPLEQQVVRLQRDVLVNTSLYTNLLNNYQQLQLIKAGKIGNVRLVDSATTSDVPVKPRRAVIIGVSVILGLIVAVATAFLRRAIFGGLESANDIENRINLPVYATVPVSENQRTLVRSRQRDGQSGILADIKSTDPAIESLRSFRTALQFTLAEAKSNILQITGATPNMGKSFISLNLAAVLADSGCRVLLIDADLRKGALHTALGQQRENGLSEIIVQGRTLEDVVRRDVRSNLDFVATGEIVPNPAEVISSKKFAHFLESMTGRYDIVLVDSPPILPVAETSTIAMLAGLTFLVARRGVSTIGELDEAKKRLTQVGVNPKGIIFNCVVPRPGRYGYSDGRYRYSYYTYAGYLNEKA
ncbi:polysaccharide biosynthesis tyrosine autokinase [Burkholderia sp. USMB20]|uniref:polysaccharide biosynthesis tyrosine autokinase n=1 Tax=Burkholderia sp. USMB20 TaxID=1571773 RepID=UPI000AA0E026|nr:polysaccharide biosynthesis tyrosine autokinase [Burkholderia sp. USMB20]